MANLANNLFTFKQAKERVIVTRYYVLYDQKRFPFFNQH